MSFQEIILLLTFIGSCIYATVSLTIKVLEFLLKSKKAVDSVRSQRQNESTPQSGNHYENSLTFP